MNRPFVSIGLPVYNGGSFLRQALDSLLEQDYTNFEIIISDNASTDATAEISKEYSILYPNIRYHRHVSTMWATGNFNYVFHLSAADYFLWASHNEYWEKNYLSRCIELLESSKKLVLVGSSCNSVDMKNSQVILVDNGLTTVGLAPYERFTEYLSSLCSGRNVNGIFYGVYRSSVLRKAMPMLQVIANDHLMLAQLCLEGEFLTIQESLFAKKQGGMSATMKTIAEGEQIHNPLLIKMPYFIRELLLQKVIFTARALTFKEKIRLSWWSFAHYINRCLYKKLFLQCRNTLYRVVPVWARHVAKKIFQK